MWQGLMNLSQSLTAQLFRPLNVPPFEMFGIERWLLGEMAVSHQGSTQTTMHASLNAKSLLWSQLAKKNLILPVWLGGSAGLETVLVADRDQSASGFTPSIWSSHPHLYPSSHTLLQVVYSLGIKTQKTPNQTTNHQKTHIKDWKAAFSFTWT